MHDLWAFQYWSRQIRHVVVSGAGTLGFVMGDDVLLRYINMLLVEKVRPKPTLKLRYWC